MASSTTRLGLSAVLLGGGAADCAWSSLPGLTARVPKRRLPRAPRLTMEMPRRRLHAAQAPASARISPDSGPKAAAAADAGETATGKAIHGKCFVVGDNIDTDQIIPAEYLTLVPSRPDEYEKLGSYAMIGLPGHYGKFMADGATKSDYSVVIGGANFGCGSSREHAPVSLGAAGVRVVVAESFARIFFRNSVATGELYPVETGERILDRNKTGDLVTVDLERDVLINHRSGEKFSLVSIGDAGPVIDAGGIFNYARATGMIASRAS